ncbi:phytanoyl-CoA dioxygenase family protein [Sarocladium implicatum]|nr:phytanoyl-CoA dioxygenase family protein [Sarocladium implicatum]
MAHVQRWGKVSSSTPEKGRYSPSTPAVQKRQGRVSYFDQVNHSMSKVTQYHKEAQRSVVMYSLEATNRLTEGAARPLAQLINHNAAANAQTILSPWRRFYEPIDVGELGTTTLTRIAALEAENLRKKWVDLYQNTSKKERLDMDSLDLSFDGVVDLIKSTCAKNQTEQEESIMGKITGRFHSICDTVHAHSAFLKMLPEGNEYVSIFTGSLNAVIKASVNHKRTAELLDEALTEICESVSECLVNAELFPTPDLVDKIADLYAHIFVFLSSYMDYLMRKRRTRLLDSFNENSSQNFDTERNRIKSKINVIRNLVQQGHYAEGRDTRLTVQQIAQDVRVGQEGNERHQAEMRDYAARLERELAHSRRERRELTGRVAELGFRIENLLENQAFEWHAFREHMESRPEVLGFHNPALISFRAHSRTPSPVNNNTYQYTAEEVSISSAHLEDFFHRDRVRLLGRDQGPSKAPREVLRRIVQWTRSTEDTPSILWIDGPFSSSRGNDNPLSRLAGTVIDFAAQSHVPVMSYFCELRRGEALKSGNTPELQALLALVSALIRQMVELLLPAFNTDVDLSKQRFARIDGTMDCWGEAMSLIKDMVQLLPESDKVFCVVDGMNWLDDRRTQGYIQQLVEVLRTCGFRVLLTTSGRAAALRQATTKQEALLVDNIGRADEWISRRDLD